MRWLAAICVVAACSPSAPNNVDADNSSKLDASGSDLDDGATSGSRLKLSWYDFADGTRQWAGLYDAQKKEGCSISGPWTDNNYYCLPEYNGEVVYLDAGCQQKALHYYVDSVCPQAPAKYYLDSGTVGCVSRPATLYLRGAQQTPATYRYKNSDGTCGTAITRSASDAIYAFGTAVPATDLVKLSISAPDSTTGRLGARFFQSDDGMRFPYALHDSMLDLDCAIEYEYGTQAQTSRCVPIDARYAYYAHDASCAQPEMALANTCNPPAYAYTFPSTSCADESETYYQVSGTTPSTPLYYPSGGSCTSTTATTGYTYYSLGNAITPAQMDYVADSGQVHRVQLIHNTTPDGLRYRDPYVLYDSQLGAQCEPVKLPDGTIRCVPLGSYVYSYFSNSGCTVPVDVIEVYKGPATCSTPTVPKFGLKTITPDACSYSYEIHPVTGAHTGTVYSGSPGSCFAYTPYEATLYDVGAEMDITGLVGASIAVDGN
ncbi:MAG: hypothetical protein QM831_08275 [Kofleriaceae bacterium]